MLKHSHNRFSPPTSRERPVCAAFFAVWREQVRDIESGGAFHLALLENGSLVISDPATGYWMALEAFGTDNRRVFAELLQRDDPQHAAMQRASEAMR